MDGTYLTALRTGAASGVATELLSRDEAGVVAIIGAGVQARTQLEAVCTVRDVEKVWVYDCVAETAAVFIEEMKTKGDPIPSEIMLAESPAQAVSDADIICTATTSSKPVFNDDSLKPGVHLNGVGSYTPEMQEIPSPTVVRSKVVVDSRSACLSEAGDIIIPLKQGLITEAHIQGEIGEVAAGKIPGRQSDEDLTCFKSVGLAVQDVAVAELIQRRAKELDLGTDIEI
jgi:ornithine cyclodeaminase